MQPPEELHTETTSVRRNATVWMQFSHTLVSNENIMSERATTHEQLQWFRLQDKRHDHSLLPSKTVGLDSIALDLKKHSAVCSTTSQSKAKSGDTLLCVLANAGKHI